MEGVGKHMPYIAHELKSGDNWWEPVLLWVTRIKLRSSDSAISTFTH